MTDRVYGRKTVLELLEKNKTINKILIAKGTKGAVIDSIMHEAKKQRVIVSWVPRSVFDRIKERHQGVVAYVSPQEYTNLDTMVDACDIKTNPVLCILDGITDPHNFGAVARSAYVLGVKGLIIPERNSCGINDVVVKASAGAIVSIPVARVTNIVATQDYLKDKGFWIVGLAADGPACWDYDTKRPIALVVGSEGKGIKRLVAEHCDDIIGIPQIQAFDSLNVSCASSIMFYEIMRQRGDV